VKKTPSRSGGRRTDALRPIAITRHFTKHAEGSVLIAQGDTRVLCTASVEDGVPPFMKGRGEGWITAEWRQTPNNQRARYYTITSIGRRQLGEEEEGFAELMTAAPSYIRASEAEIAKPPAGHS